MQFESLPYAPLRITSGFGSRQTGIPGASIYHKGVDIGADKSKYPGSDGGPVVCVLPGIVSSSGYSTSRGNYVIVNHGMIDGQDIQTICMHFKSRLVSQGQSVETGMELGRMGATGIASGVHLHFELHINNTAVDPEPYFYNIKKQEEEEMIYSALSEVPAWAQEAVKRGLDNKWIAVDDTGDFSVYESNLQTAVWFYSAGLWDRQKPSSQEPSSWAEAAVGKAVDGGIIVGNQDGDLNLHSLVTREETMVFLDRAGVLTEAEEANN